jgi:hypothetical protein
MPELGQRVLCSLLVFFALLTLARPAGAQFVPPPPPQPITQQGYHCKTHAGICRLKAPSPLGRQCTCQQNDGSTIPGLIVR